MPAPRLYVHGVREDPNMVGPCAPCDDRLARGTSDNQHVGRTTNELRNNCALDSTSPTRAGTQVMALHEQDVRNSTAARPRNRSLRRERTPAGDHDDIGLRSSESRSDSGRHWIVMAQKPVHTRQ